MQDLIHLEVPCDSSAPGKVRRAIRHTVQLTDLLDALLLVASELVTNAVQHSRCREGETLIIGVSENPRVRISVLDPGRAGCNANPVDRSPTTGGMGLKIVGKLASGWGSRRLSCGYEVWAELTALA